MSMRGSFFGMNVSLSGLFMAQRNLDTISHNLANIMTDGYSRQAVNQQASSPFRLYNHTGMVGSGVDIVSVARVRDIYLDQKFWFQNTISGEWTQKFQLMDQIQVRIGDASDIGYTRLINEFYDAMQELAKDPSDMSIRSLVKEEAVSFTTYFNTLAINLEQMQADINFDIKTKVDLVNSIGHRIETLNKQIYQIEMLGERANDLRDARDLLVDQLSSLVNVEVGEMNYGKLSSGADDMRFYIYIGGTQFLQHFDRDVSVVNELRCVSRDEKLNEEDVDDLFDILWTKPVGKDIPVNITGGELRGLLDVRDGNAALVQEARYNMLGTNIQINLDVSAAIPPLAVSMISLSLDFNEFVRNVENMTAGELASYIETQINRELSAAGAAISPDAMARVYTTPEGYFAVDLTGVNLEPSNPAGPAPILETFVFTASPELRLKLGLFEIPGGGTASAVTGAKDVVQAVGTNSYKGIPYYQRKLNEYVRVYAMAFNEGFIDSNTNKLIEPDEVLTGHADGYNINQELGEPPAGTRFFTMRDPTGKLLGTGDFLMMSDERMPSLYGLDPESDLYQMNINAIYNAYQKVTAKNFTVSADIVNDVSLISTSSAAGEVENSNNLTAVLSQRFNRHMFSEGNCEDFMQSLTADSAVSTNQAEYMYENQSNFINLLIERRNSISGVSEDEEFADMVRQQHAYNASAMMITTYNQIYDTLINRLGLI